MADVGNFFVVYSFFQIAAIFSRQGFDNLLLMKASNFIKKNKVMGNSILLSSSLLVSLFFSFIIFITFSSFEFIFLRVWNAHVVDLISIILLALPFYSIIWLFGEFIKSSGKAALSAIIQISLVPIFTVIISYTAKVSNIKSLIEIYVVVTCIFSLSYLAKYRRILVFPSINVIIKFYKEASEYMFATVFGIIMGVTDVLMLGSLSSSLETGIYVISFKIASLNMLIILGVTSTFSPKFSNEYKIKNYSALYKLYQESLLLTTIPVLIFSLFIIYFSDEILIFFNKNTLISNSVLLILIVGFIIRSFASTGLNFLAMAGQGAYLKKVIFFAALINVVLNYIFIIQYGANGAAVATVISISISSVLFVQKSYLMIKYKEKK